MSYDDVPQEIKVRGRWFPIPFVRFGKDATSRALAFFALALYALDDPRVDEVLRTANINIQWPDGRREFLFPPEAKKTP